MRPVFIGGCPRSGTTLVGSLLGSHPDAVCVPESQFKVPWLRQALHGDGILDRDDVLREVEHDFRYRIWNLDSSALRQRLPERGNVRQFLFGFAAAFGEQCGRQTARLMVDHTPSNIRYFNHLAELFPDMLLIHVVRDPRGVAASMKPLDWGPNHSYTCAAFWSQQIAFGLAAEGLGDRRVVRVRYEDLINAPRSTLERLCRSVGIDFTPRMFQADGFRIPRYSRGQHRLVGECIDVSRASAWQRTLTPREVELIEASVCDLLEHFGYPAEFGREARPISGLEHLTCSLRELVWTEIINRWRLRRRRRRSRLENG